MSIIEKIFAFIATIVGLVTGTGIIAVGFVDGKDTIGWYIVNGFGWMFILAALSIPAIALYNKYCKS